MTIRFPIHRRPNDLLVHSVGTPVCKANGEVYYGTRLEANGSQADQLCRDRCFARLVKDEPEYEYLTSSSAEPLEFFARKLWRCP